MFTLSYPCTCGYTPIYHFQVELVHLQLLGLALWPFPTSYYPYCLAPVAYHKLNLLLSTNRFPDLEKKMSVFFFFFLQGKIKSHLQRENHPTQYHRQTSHQPPGVKSVCSAESHHYEAVRCSSSAFLRMQPPVSFLDEMEKTISGCRVLALQTSAFQLSTVRDHLL